MPSMAPPTLNAATSDGVAPKAKGEPEPGIITPAKLTTGGQIPSNISISRPYDFAGQSAASWIPADAAPSPISKPGDLGTTWRSFPPESPLGSQFSPYSHPPLSSATWTSASSESGSRDDSTWGNYPPPVRSMSYGGEPLASNHPTQYPSLPHSRQFDRRSSALSDVYPPPLSVTVPGMDVGHTSGIDHLVPLSAGAVPPPTFEGWHNQHQQHSQLPYSKSGDVFGDWGLGGDGDGQHLDTSEPGPHNEPNPNIYYTRR
ncbi:Fc.00g064950.m01.CDS01 [Cosmosporella sp. VM-42]